MGRWVGQKMAQKIGYPLWMAPKPFMCSLEKTKREKDWNCELWLLILDLNLGPSEPRIFDLINTLWGHWQSENVFKGSRIYRSRSSQSWTSFKYFLSKRMETGCLPIDWKHRKVKRWQNFVHRVHIDSLQHTLKYF